jgi:hypothetical protein
MECKICLHKYDEVVRIPYSINSCGHCYCISCLNKINSQNCPTCRGKITSKTINRAILELITNNSSDTGNHNQTKIKDFLQLKDLDYQLHSKIKTKQNECNEFFKTIREKVQIDFNKKLQLLLKNEENLATQLIDAEKNYEDKLISIKFKVNAEMRNLEEKFNAEFNLESLKEKSSNTKQQLNAESENLDKINFNLVFKSTNFVDENYLGRIETQTENQAEFIDNKTYFMRKASNQNASSDAHKNETHEVSDLKAKIDKPLYETLRNLYGFNKGRISKLLETKERQIEMEENSCQSP